MDSLKRQVANHKQEEEALLNEMEVTGQAFEDMQEQNARLIQQLREKVRDRGDRGQRTCRSKTPGSFSSILVYLMRSPQWSR